MSDYTLADHPAACSCPSCGGPVDDHESFSLDPFAGATHSSKPIWTLPTIVENLNRSGYDWYTNNYGELNDGVLNFGFWNNYEELANSYYVNATGTIAFNEAFYEEDFSAFTAGQRTITSEAIGLWDDLVAISFRETKSGNADITFGNTFTGGAQAYAYLPFGDIYDDFYSEVLDFDETGRLGGDVWIDGFVASNFFPLDDSYYAKTTMVHEIGHAIGLSHPGDYDALGPDGEVLTPTYENQAEYAQDTLQYSIMSYFDASYTGAQYIDWSLLNFAYPSTPQVHDVATIQAIYGADMTTRTGNTTYGFNSTADRAEFDFALNKRPIVTIWDAGGNDTLDFSGWNTDSVIDLAPGSFSSGGGTDNFFTLEQVNANRAALGFAPRSQATFDFYEGLKAANGVTSALFTDNVAIAYGATIENAIGGGGDDVITGNTVANTLTGKGGADLFVFKTAGVSGADRIIDFGGEDVLAVEKKLADSNNDGIITWGSRTLKLDTSDGDSVRMDTVNNNTGLRYLGTSDGLFYYGDAKVRPVASSGQKVFEGLVGNDTLKGSTSAATTDVFFFDTAGAAPTTGNDKVTFTAKDLLVTTSAINDSDGDRVINFGSTLDIPGNGGTVALSTGSTAIHAVEFDGTVVNNGITYYVYSSVGSMVGVGDVHF
jgi:hypothetical protein